MQRPAFNLIAGFSAAALSCVVGVLVVPIYVRQLGTEGYALVGLYLTLQVVLQAFEVGLTATASREVARARAGQSAEDAANVIRALARISWGTAAVITLLLLAAAPAIAGHWLQLQQLSVQQALTSLLLMAVGVGTRWPAGLDQNILYGSDRLATASAIAMGYTLLSHVGGAVLLATGSIGLTGFFGWQVLASVGYACAMRLAARRAFAVPGSGRPDFAHLRGVKDFSLVMVVIGLLGLVLTNFDKFLLSRMLLLGDFGHYMLATVVSGLTYAAVTPVYHWAYPRLSQLVTGPAAALEQEYRRLGHAVAALLLPAAMFIVISGEAVVSLWIGDREIAAAVGPILALLTVGSTLHGLMFIPSALTLAAGAARLALRLNVFLLAVLVPTMVFLTWQYGATGAATSWLLTHASYVLVGGWITHRALIPGLALRWLLQDIGPPLLLCVILGALGKTVVLGPLADAPPVVVVAWGLLVWLCACGLVVAGSARLRQLAHSTFAQLARGRAS